MVFMDRIDPRQPFRIYYQWIALIFLGLALGSGIRLATGKTPGSAPPDEGMMRTASRGNLEPSSSETPGRRARSPRPAADNVPPLTAEQAGHVLEDPTRFQPNLDRLLRNLADDATPQYPEAAALAELFGWDGKLIADFSDSLRQYAASVRQLIDSRAVIESPKPGFIRVSYGGDVADGHRQEVTALKENLLSLIGAADLHRIDALGFFEVLESNFGPDQDLLVKLGPADPIKEGDEPRVNLQVFRSSDSRMISSTVVSRNSETGEWQVVQSVPLLPGIDWSVEIERVVLPNPPTTAE